MKWIRILFLMVLVFPLWALVRNDKLVTDWTSSVLKETLSVSYLQTPEQVKSTSKYYSYNGWDNIANFLGSRMPNVRKYKITTTPVPDGPAKVVRSGIYKGAPFWRVNQAWQVPQVSVEVWFSVIVIQKPDGSLLIDSVSMHGERTASSFRLE